MVRAQAHTLEAFMASLLLIGSLVFALQVTAVTPLTASTSSQHIENQQQRLAGGLLDAAAANESLADAVLYWNGTAGRFEGADPEEGYYQTGGPPTTFGRMLNRTFRDRGIAFNVDVWYVDAGGSIRRQRMVRSGTPSDHAVSVTRTVTLYDDDRVGPSGKRVDTVTSYFAPDTDTESGLYNVLVVEVTVWRI